MGKLTDIHGGDGFKARIYGAAAFNIEKLSGQLSEMEPHTITSIKGIGDSTGKKIIELLETGKLDALENLIAATPPGVIEMLNIKGIGPKKISTIWKEMNIESVGELLYACQENRLKLYKGFGEKTQENVIESIEFYLRSQGHFLFAQAEALYPQIKNYLEKLFGSANVLATGNFAMQRLVIEEMEFAIEAPEEIIKQKMLSAQPPEIVEENEKSILYKLANGLKLRFYICKNNLNTVFFEKSCSEEFTAAFKKTYKNIDLNQPEKAVFEKAGIQFIPALLREKEQTLKLAAKNKIPELIQPEDIKGIIHSHSKWSDGENSIEEMIQGCIAKGYEYLVISDHSKSAGYANGLQEERIKAQHGEIDELNKKYPGFKVFKSIECDILNDGSLDYSNSILSTFDLVITSVHSNLKMTEEKAMNRLLKAIENPYTTILGHMTGRLLLSRKGYPVNHKTIIDACAANKVVIELNAHPSRLDMDWQYIDYALEKNVLISINPDAHTIDGFDDIRFGTLAAQKGMVTKTNNLSSFSLKEFEKFIAAKRQ